MKYNIGVLRWMPQYKLFEVDDESQGEHRARSNAIRLAEDDDGDGGWHPDDQKDFKYEIDDCELANGQFTKENEEERHRRYRNQVDHLMMYKGIRGDPEWDRWWVWLNTCCIHCGDKQTDATAGDPCEMCGVELESLNTETLAELRAKTETFGHGPEQERE